MNFTPNIRPDFSVPPPPMNFIPGPNFRPAPPFNPNPPFPPLNFNPAMQSSYASSAGHHGPTGLNFSPTPSFYQSNSHQNGRGRKDFRSGRGANRGGQRSRGGHDRNIRHQSGNNQNHDHGSQGHPKKKKEKIDKRDLPENNAFSCDICDRGFKTEDKFKEHVDGHVKCSYKDCPYVAAPKLVQIHVNTQHRAGLAKKIWSMESVEDIRKWREDRKRNYPTAANIQKKKELRAERLKRGEVLETKDFSKMRGRGNRDSGRGRGRHRGRFNRGNHRRHGRFENDVQDVKIGGDVDDATVAVTADDDDDGPPEVKKICRSSSQETEGTVRVDQGIETTKLLEDSENSLERGKDESHVSSLSLLTGYGSSSSDEGDSDTEQNATDLPKDSLLKACSSENDKAGISDKSTLFQPFIVDKERKSLNSSCSQEQTVSTNMNQISSPLSEDSSEGSPVAFERDPFNLTGVDQESSLTSDAETNTKNSQTIRSNNSNLSSHSLMEDDEGTNVLQQRVSMENIKDLSVDDSGCTIQQHKNEHFNDFPIDDGEIFPHFEQMCEKLPSPKSKSVVSSTDDLNGSQDRKLEHSRSPDKERGRRRGEHDTGKRRQERRPQAKSYTLLEKLLAPQIRQERNKILQCVYYIVKHKFFD